MRSQLNELCGSQCNNKYDNGMQHFLFPPTGAPFGRPRHLARVCSPSTSLILQSRLLRHYLFRFIPGFLRNSRSLVRWTEDQRTIVKRAGKRGDRRTTERRTDSARDSCGMRRCGRRRGAKARSGILRSALRSHTPFIPPNWTGSGRTQKNGNALAHVPCRR